MLKYNGTIIQASIDLKNARNKKGIKIYSDVLKNLIAELKRKKISDKYIEEVFLNTNDRYFSVSTYKEFQNVVYAYKGTKYSFMLECGKLYKVSYTLGRSRTVTKNI